jgi:hypothetical protein
LPAWALPSLDLWAAFPTGRRASAKARAFTAFVQNQPFGGNAQPEAGKDRLAQALRWKGPASGPAFALRWDPDPRWASRSGRRRPVRCLGRGDPADGWAERGSCPSRAWTRPVRVRRPMGAETELSSVVGLPQGFRGTGR